MNKKHLRWSVLSALMRVLAILTAILWVLPFLRQSSARAAPTLAGSANPLDVTIHSRPSTEMRPGSFPPGSDLFAFAPPDAILSGSPLAQRTSSFSRRFPAAINTPPVAISDTFTVTEDLLFNASLPGVLVNDSDVDADNLTAVLDTAPANGLFGTSLAWSAPQTVYMTGTVGEYTSLAIVDGYPAISFYAGAPLRHLMYVRALDADGGNWDLPVSADSSIDDTGLWTSLAIVNGNPAISYYDTTNDDLKYVRASDSTGAAWGSPIVVSSTGNVGELATSLAVVNGRPAILFHDVTHGTLHYVRALDADGTTWGTPVFLDGPLAGAFGHLTVVDGRPAASYYGDNPSDDLRYIRANDADGDSWPSPIIVDDLDNGNLGWDTSLTIVNGKPAISYYERMEYNLRYVQANDASGSSWGTPVIVDAAGNIGQYTSLAVVEGRPAISYWDELNNDLKFVQAVDVDGRYWGLPTTLDSAGDVGRHTSLAMVNGSPAVSYFRGDTSDLKFIRAVPDVWSGAFGYMPGPDYCGTDSFTYHAWDGLDASNTVSVDLNVTCVNDSPVAQSDRYTATEDITLTIAAPGVLGNDGDVDKDPLSAVLDDLPAHGTLALGTDGAFAYTPTLNYNGSDWFSYHASDGISETLVVTVALTILAANDPPVAVTDAYTTTEDSGTLSVPSPGVLLNDTDVELDSLTAILDTDAVSGTLTLRSDGSFDYLPDENFCGVDSFAYHAYDQVDSSEPIIVPLNVLCVNDLPFADDDEFSVAEDSVDNALDVLAGDTDVDGDTLAIFAVGDPPNGSAIGSGANLSYSPDPDFYGSDVFTYTVTDGRSGFATAAVTVTVISVNDPPVAGSDRYTTTNHAILVVAAPGVLANDSDLESDPIEAVLGTPPASGLLSLLSDGSFVYTPTAAITGLVTFTYYADDGTDASNLAEVTINVEQADYHIFLPLIIRSGSALQLLETVPGHLGLGEASRTAVARPRSWKQGIIQV